MLDAAVILTYRCNARCQMCHTWQFPTRPEEEITAEHLRKLPDRLGRLNITGGEPMLRKDIEEIVAVLHKKAHRLEISTNGYFTDRIVDIARKYPDITIRVSLEGLPRKNDEIRGLKHGFDRGLRTILRLKELGIKDIGFSIVIQDANAEDLLDFYHLAEGLDVEFAQAVPHNSFYFHKLDNKIENQERVAAQIERLMAAFLRSRRVKNWFRAYLNRGLVDYVKGAPRVLACGAGSDIFFVGPLGEVYPCNVMEESMGNLKEQSFEEIWTSQRASEVREKVRTCPENCWMTGTAVPAIKRNILRASFWVLRNKVRLLRGRDIVLCDQAGDGPGW